MIDAATTGFTFGVLGPLEVWDGASLVPVRAAKQRIILGCLLMNADRSASGSDSVSLSELYTALWGDDLPDAPKAAVHNYVRRLRASVHPHLISTTPNGYRLAVDRCAIDLFHFRRFIAQARQHCRDGDLANESIALRDALALWRGAPLADVPSEALHRFEVPSLVEARLGTLERRIAVDLELGAHADVIGELRMLTSTYPLRERFWSYLVLALYRAERSADALAAYHQARSVLAEESGIDPGPRLRALYQGVLDGDPRLAVS